MINFSITKTRDSVTPSLKNIIKALDEPGRRKLLTQTGEKFIEITKQNFGNSGRYRGNVWPRLSDKYSKRVGRKNATLYRSGDLYNSIKLSSPRGNFIIAYTKSPYAAAQAFGSKRTNLPARNYWPMENVTPTYSRLIFGAERELVLTIGRNLTILSNGQLPSLSSNIQRSSFTSGNPFTSQS